MLDGRNLKLRSKYCTTVLLYPSSLYPTKSKSPTGVLRSPTTSWTWLWPNSQPCGSTLCSSRGLGFVFRIAPTSQRTSDATSTCVHTSVGSWGWKIDSTCARSRVRNSFTGCTGISVLAPWRIRTRRWLSWVWIRQESFPVLRGGFYLVGGQEEQGEDIEGFQKAIRQELWKTMDGRERCSIGLIIVALSFLCMQVTTWWR
jgi:hypothetical protein